MRLPSDVQDSFNPSHFLAFNHGKTGKMSKKMATTIRVAASGRVKKIRKFPWDSNRDWRRLFSINGLKTMAITMGAAC